LRDVPPSGGIARIVAAQVPPAVGREALGLGTAIDAAALVSLALKVNSLVGTDRAPNNAPALAPAILAIGGGSYGVLYAAAGVCAIIGAFAILPVKSVR
jgi:hypothetical protein